MSKVKAEEIVAGANALAMASNDLFELANELMSDIEDFIGVEELNETSLKVLEHLTGCEFDKIKLLVEFAQKIENHVGAFEVGEFSYDDGSNGNG